MGPEADRDRIAQVLIVDDDTEWGWRLEERLSAEFEILVIKDGQDALSKLAGVKAVVMEIELPGMDGAELAVSALSGDGISPSIIVVTGLDPEDLRIQVLESLPNVVVILREARRPGNRPRCRGLCSGWGLEGRSGADHGRARWYRNN